MPKSCSLLWTILFWLLNTRSPFQQHCHCLSGGYLSPSANPGASPADLQLRNWSGRPVHSHHAVRPSAQPSGTLSFSAHFQFSSLSGESMGSQPSSNKLPLPYMGQSVCVANRTLKILILGQLSVFHIASQDALLGHEVIKLILTSI